jgi:hypothetical protein
MMLTPLILSDLDVIMPNANSQILDLSTGECLLSLSANESLKSLDLCRLPPPLSEVFPLPPFHLPRTFLSERNSLGSVDWPPIGSSLLPEDGNAPQDDNIGLTVSDVPPRFAYIDLITYL